MDTRRQSGLWAHNTRTGHFEQQHPPPNASRNPGPYQYYQPSRRSFSARAATSDTLGNTTGLVAGNAVGKIDDDLRATTDEDLGPGTTTINPNNPNNRREGRTAVSEESPLRAKKAVDMAASSPPTNTRPEFTQDDDYDDDDNDLDDDIPMNLRTKPWSPEPMDPSPTAMDSAVPATRHASNASDMVRRDSVPHRSPLQKLEGHFGSISKEEKRARMEEAEDKARRRSLSGKGKQAVTAEEDGMQRVNTLRSGKGRVVSDGSQQSGQQGSSDRQGQDRSRAVSAGEAASVNDTRRDGRDKYGRPADSQRTSAPPRKQPDEELQSPRARTRDSTSSPDRRASTQRNRDPPIVNNPRPYHHAPAMPRELGIRQEAQPYHHAPAVPRDQTLVQRSTSNATETRQANTTAQRSSTGSQSNRRREAEIAGAGLAAAGGAALAGYEISAADRGKAAHERRKSQEQTTTRPGSRSNSAHVGGAGGAGRAGILKVQTKGLASTGSTNEDSLPSGKQQPLSAKSDSAGGYNSTDPVPRHQVASSLHSGGPKYQVPPQTANGQQARKQVGFHSATLSTAAAGAGVAAVGAAASSGTSEGQHRRFSGMFHRQHDQRQPPSQPGVSTTEEEWRKAQVVELSAADLEFDSSAPQPTYAQPPEGANSAWWEKNKSSRRATVPDTRQAAAQAQLDGPYEEEATMFQPQLFLKCGPLLRYTGIRREKRAGGQPDRAVWRGTVMIVTEDAQSDLASPPSLRFFAQPMDLLQPPSREAVARGEPIPPELEDPLAGQVKVSRTGRPLYVRPVHDLEGGVDLSREENNNGLYSASRTPLLGPQASSTGATVSGGADPTRRITFQDKTRIRKRDGEKAGKYRDVKAVRLYTERGHTFWRFSLAIELGSAQHRVAYRINNGPSLGFWVPGRAESMNAMFHSCNGFSLSVNGNDFSGPDPLWRDVLNKHQTRPFHVMIGGGDQIYNDAAMRDTRLFGEWIRTKNPEHKHRAAFTAEMQDELEEFYLNRYAMWFSQGLFAMAGSQIPMVNVWDDHDIIDGYGSYPHRLMASKVFTGLGSVAFKYYMLFQHQSIVAETEKDEPSWILGASPGPYINEQSRSVFMDLGPHLKLLGIDCRTERMRDEIVSQETYELLFQRCEAEIQKGETKHLIVLLGVPIAYPRLNFLENILTSRVMDPIKAIGRTGMLGGFVNKFDGGVEILDDLDDHWTAKHHKAERNWFVQELQEFAAQRSVRVTILGGDVHLGAVGQFYTPRKFGVSKDKDHRYMPNVISSAIVNTPPPAMMADVLNRRNKVHHLDSETDEDLIPMFEYDVDGSKRNNKTLLPRRNYCTIREFLPGTTPPASPRLEDPPLTSASFGSSIQDESLWSAARRPTTEDRDRRFPPGSMRRTMSLTRSGASNLVRRLSGSRRKGSNAFQSRPSISDQSPFHAQTAPGMGRSNSLGPSTGGGSYFSPPDPAAGTNPERPTFKFHRRPTNFSEKEIRRAAAKGGAPPDEDGEEGVERPPAGHINLEGGLDISLNMEIDQHDPAGHTQGYRLLVPALFYEGVGDGLGANASSRLKPGRTSFINRLTSVRRRKQIEGDSAEAYGNDGYEDRDDGSRTPTPVLNQRYNSQPQQQQPQQHLSWASASSRQRPTSTALGGSTDGAFDERSAVAAATRQPIENSDPGTTTTNNNSNSNAATNQHQTRGAFDKGFNLSAPPIGAGHQLYFTPAPGTAPAYAATSANTANKSSPRASGPPNGPLTSSPPDPPYGRGSLAAPQQQQQQRQQPVLPQTQPQTARQTHQAIDFAQRQHQDQHQPLREPDRYVGQDDLTPSEQLDHEQGGGHVENYDDDEDEDGSIESPLSEQILPQRRTSKAERFFGVGDAPVPGRSGGIIGGGGGAGGGGVGAVGGGGGGGLGRTASKKKPAWKIW